MPKASMSMSTVTKMKASAALRCRSGDFMDASLLWSPEDPPPTLTPDPAVNLPVDAVTRPSATIMAEAALDQKLHGPLYDMRGLVFTAGDVVVVTGAGSGIGKATALAAARSGLSVALWDICAEACPRHEIRSRGGGNQGSRGHCRRRQRCRRGESLGPDLAARTVPVSRQQCRSRRAIPRLPSMTI